MRVAFLSDHGASGGAAFAAQRLARGLHRRGHELAWLFGMPALPPARDPAYRRVPLYPATRLLHRAARRLPSSTSHALSTAIWRHALDRALRRLRPDVIHVHNLHSAGWDVDLLRTCLDHAPVVWTLHDMWGLTGSCAYSMGCRRFETSCTEACPERGRYPVLAPRLVEGALERRHRLFRDAGEHLVCVVPSRWLSLEAMRSAANPPHLRQIWHGIDHEQFCGTSPTEARAALGVPADGRPTLLAISANLASPFKGTDILLGALEQLNQPVRVLLAGENPPRLPSPAESFALGELKDESRTARAFAACDLMVHPAKADNQPLVLLEALACERPVVASGIGGIPEEVGEAGWLAAEASVDAFAAALREALGAPQEWRRRGLAGRERILSRATLAHTALRHEALYQSILVGSAIDQAALDALAPTP